MDLVVFENNKPFVIDDYHRRLLHGLTGLVFVKLWDSREGGVEVGLFTGMPSFRAGRPGCLPSTLPAEKNSGRRRSVFS